GSDEEFEEFEGSGYYDDGVNLEEYEDLPYEDEGYTDGGETGDVYYDDGDFAEFYTDDDFES
ncbi:MAG: hypothetical protein MJ193_03510, partial [Clostridia bacterium]|nr:hypothetical protein [Clostridia bacterium]